MGIADAGATGHFLQPGTPVKNIRPTDNPISISQPDGGKLESTHECEIDNPKLPQAARAAHIVPGLAHKSLISIKMLIYAGCKVTHDTEHVKFFYRGKVVWKSTRESLTGLWALSFTHKQKIAQTIRHKTDNHTDNNAYQTTSKEEPIRYLHQCLFCPPKSTILKAIKNNQLATWPGLTTESVQKYLPESCPATDKCYMKRQRKGIISTTDKIKDALEQIEIARCMNPPE